MTIEQIRSHYFLFSDNMCHGVLVLYSFLLLCYLHFDAGLNEETISLTETASSNIQTCATFICPLNSERIIMLLSVLETSIVH